MTAKLILSMDGLVLKEIALDKERMTIGRKPHNDIQIDNLAISGEHASVVTILSDSFLEDMNSTNGTLVNGVAIKKHFLQHGDVIELGKYKLKYFNEKPAYPEASTFQQPLPTSPADRPGTAVPGGGGAANEYTAGLKILSGGNTGKELELVKTMTTLGKPGVQVAVIARRPQGYFLTHVEGGSLPTVNGRPLDAQGSLLSDGDVIVLAGVRMEFSVKR